MDQLMTFSGATRFDPDIEEWLWGEPDALYSIARTWFSEIRECGPDVTELLHDGCPVACVSGAAFAYVNVFTSHVNIGFFQGARLSDPKNLLEGAGKRMRHVKLRPDRNHEQDALRTLIKTAYIDIKVILQN